VPVQTVGVEEAERDRGTEKKCTQCGEVKPLDAFGFSRSGRSRELRPRPACKACRVAYETARYEVNPGPNRARAAAWYAANTERGKANAKRSAKANPERVRATKDRWAKLHPEAGRATVQRRRVRLRSNPTENFKDTEIFDRDGWICGICGEPIDLRAKAPNGDSVSLDHIVPMARGGSHTRRNVQAAHLACNQFKGARSEIDNS